MQQGSVSCALPGVVGLPLARRLYQGAAFSVAVKAELFKQAEEKQAPSSC